MVSNGTGKRKVPGVCLLLQSASATIWDEYVPLPEPVDTQKSKGGRPPCELSRQLALACYKKDDPDQKPIFRCLGMDPTRKPPGCTTVCDKTYAGPHQNPQRIMDHAADCEHLPQELWEAINKKSGVDAPSVKAARLNLEGKKTKVIHAPTASSTNSSKSVLAPQPTSVVRELSRKSRIDARNANLELVQ